MRDTNFKCPETGEEFNFPRFTLIPKGNGIAIYKDPYGKQIVHPTSGVVLEPIPVENPGIPMIIGSVAQQKVRNGEYFKERAKKHAQTDEQKALKEQRFKQEFKLD